MQTSTSLYVLTLWNHLSPLQILQSGLLCAVRVFFVYFSPLLDLCAYYYHFVIFIECGKENKAALKVLGQYPFVNRWYLFISKHTACKAMFEKHFTPQVASETKKAKKKEGINLGHTGGYLKLENVKEGDTVVTRFPPEPSGYLHIGHAKAALLNQYYAKQYNGKLLIRFDDTNPTKEKEEYMDNILRDLKTLGIPGGDKVTYTSDYFELIEKLAEDAIRNGDAYVDNTPLEEIREARMVGDVTPARSNSVEENLRLWEEMKRGSEEGCKCIVRAKIETEYGPMKCPNKALRDPALYRVIPDADHARLGYVYCFYSFLVTNNNQNQIQGLSTVRLGMSNC